MTLDKPLVELIQWMVSQGIGVAVAVAVLWLVGRKVDQQNTLLVQLDASIGKLTQAVSDHAQGRQSRDA